MKTMTPCACIMLFITILSLANAQGRAPHGLINESPLVNSPSAYDFFHPEAQNQASKAVCTTSGCSPLPMVAQVEAAESEESELSIPQENKHQIGAGGIVGIVFGFAFVASTAMGAYYVVAKQRDNMNQDTSVQSDP